MGSSIVDCSSVGAVVTVQWLINGISLCTTVLELECCMHQHVIWIRGEKKNNRLISIFDVWQTVSAQLPSFLTVVECHILSFFGIGDSLELIYSLAVIFTTHPMEELFIFVVCRSTPYLVMTKSQA